MSLRYTSTIAFRHPLFLLSLLTSKNNSHIFLYTCQLNYFSKCSREKKRREARASLLKSDNDVLYVLVFPVLSSLTNVRLVADLCHLLGLCEEFFCLGRISLLH